jgi:hypothetical protein
MQVDPANLTTNPYACGLALGVDPLRSLMVDELLFRITSIPKIFALPHFCPEAAVHFFFPARSFFS